MGGTVYPGIMLTAAAMYRALVALTATVQLRDVCVFTAPFFSGNTVRSLKSSSSATLLRNGCSTCLCQPVWMCHERALLPTHTHTHTAASTNPHRTLQ